MSMPLEEHDYIGLSEVSSMENSEKLTLSLGNNERKKGLNLKATELRLGLPGSSSPGRDAGDGPESLYPTKGLVSGAKRGFSDTIGRGSGKWIFPGNCGSEPDLGRNGGLLSPRGVNGGGKIVSVPENSSQPNHMASKEAVPQSPKPVLEKKPQVSTANGCGSSPSAKKRTSDGSAFKHNNESPHLCLRDRAQVIGWPPIRSYRRNSMASNHPKNEDVADAKVGSGCIYVKVSMDGAPYLRKVDLKAYKGYKEMSSALEKMFSCFTIGQCGSHGVSSRDGLSASRLMDLLHGSEYVLTYEDKDGDWMLVGDVPWEMFAESCKRLRIMKSSDAIGLAPRAVEKCRVRN